MAITSISKGDVVAITAFDDVPEHLFLVEEAYEDLITGMALTGPFKGFYGEPDKQLIKEVCQYEGT